jgi:hypothetical protein
VSPIAASHVGRAVDWLEFPIPRLGYATARDDADMVPGGSLTAINVRVLNWRCPPLLARQHDRMVQPRQPDHGGVLLAPRSWKELSRRHLPFRAEEAPQSPVPAGAGAPRSLRKEGLNGSN